MGCIPYQTVDDASRSLRNTVVLLAGQPIYINQVGGPGGLVRPDQVTLSYYTIPMSSRRPAVTCTLADPLLDISNLRLGYLNASADAVWCERFPNQGTTQGLNDTNVSARTCRSGSGDEPNWNFTSFMETGDMVGMFREQYPPVRDILAKFEGEKGFRSAAFSRCFALSKDGFRGDYLVHYKGEPVAFGDIKRGVELNNKFKHLREQLTELGINVA